MEDDAATEEKKYENVVETRKVVAQENPDVADEIPSFALKSQQGFDQNIEKTTFKIEISCKRYSMEAWFIWRGVRIGFLISLRLKPDLYGFTAHYDPVNNQYKLVVA